jgi:hypothetical protein
LSFSNDQKNNEQTKIDFYENKIVDFFVSGLDDGAKTFHQLAA